MKKTLKLFLFVAMLLVVFVPAGTVDAASAGKQVKAAKKAYKKWLSKPSNLWNLEYFWRDAIKFDLKDLDGDHVPEMLVLCPNSSDAGDPERIFTYRNGKVREILSAGHGGFSVYPSAYAVCFSGAQIDDVWSWWYKIENGKARMIAKKDGKWGADGNGGVKCSYRYTVNGKEVSKQNYKKYIKKFGKSESIDYQTNTQENVNVVFQNTRNQYYVELGKISTEGSSFYKDITGDGKPDKIEVREVSSADNPYWVKSLHVKVNGKSAAMPVEQYGYGEPGVTASYIHVSKKLQFLQFTGYGESAQFHMIYRYDAAKNKMSNAIEYPDEATEYAFSYISKVCKNGIRMEHMNQPCETGMIRWEFDYAFKKGKLRIASGVSSKVNSDVYSTDKKYNKYFRKNQFVACSSRKFYSDTGLKKVSFKVKKGDIVKLKRVKVKGKKMYAQFQKGKKTGWQRIFGSYEKVYPTMSSKGWFYGVRSGMVS